MTTTQSHCFGFRVVGPTTGRRRLVDAGAALAGYADCDDRAEVNKESYLSLYWFDATFRDFLQGNSGSTAGYDGSCWAPFIWWDIDRADDAERALADARRLVAFLLDRYPPLDEDDILAFFSGSKGYHVALPIFRHSEPSPTFHQAMHQLAEGLARAAGVTVDGGVYDKVRLFRAPNSRHAKTDLHKRRLSYRELTHLDSERIRILAAEPVPFALPSVASECSQAFDDWQTAVNAAQREAEAKAVRKVATTDAPRLNHKTLDFIRYGASEGDRHRLLYSAAANLAEFGCPPPLAHALLTESALDSGLSPKDVSRQIECGLKAGSRPKGVSDG